jgi:hypothetical protein
MKQRRRHLLDVLLGAALALAIAPASTGQWGDGPAGNPPPNGRTSIPIQGCSELPPSGAEAPPREVEYFLIWITDGFCVFVEPPA